MLATISGMVSEKLEQSLIIEANGLGYGVTVARSDLENIQTGAEARLYLHEVIREDVYDLYGFSELAAKSLFEQLLSVSGVGPKAALAILSIANLEQVQRAISTGDIAFLQSAPGIGKRGAERIAIELKDKVFIGSGLESVTGRGEADAALQAMEALGYPRSDAVKILANIPRDLSDEERIKLALKEAR